MIGTLVLLVSMSMDIAVDDVPAVPDASANPSPTAAVDSPLDPAEERRRQETAAAAVWVLIGVTILGLTMVVLVILLGGHVRRVVRAPLPERSRDDPFWYLRPDKNLAAETNVGEDRESAVGDPLLERPTDA